MLFPRLKPQIEVYGLLASVLPPEDNPDAQKKRKRDFLPEDGEGYSQRGAKADVNERRGDKPGMCLHVCVCCVVYTCSSACVYICA